MNAYHAYQQPLLAGMTRIDMLLALYDKLLGRLEAAEEALAHGQDATANTLLVRAEVLVAGLAAGVDAGRGELAMNFLRLYDFALRSIHLRTREGVADALHVLRPLHEALATIRPEARRLEEAGEIPPLDAGFAWKTA